MAGQGDYSMGSDSAAAMGVRELELPKLKSRVWELKPHLFYFFSFNILRGRGED